ncbi:MAG: RNA polymerase Rpb6 [Clostridia bacterium]|nr:RNA polymerase Rpb6 [Clostridia bacterium]
MDYKKTKSENTAVTRKMRQFDKETGNIYETLAIISKRSNQISLELKEELNKKIAEFATNTDSLEEVFENREQIEIARFYEKLPKPTLLAVQEFLDDQVYYRNPSKEASHPIASDILE